MISRRASHKLVDGRHAYCHVVIHRTEQRKDSRQRTHSVYLVRLLAHIGEFPSPDTFYELRYSSLERLHQQLRASRPRLRLPELPRARRLGNQHPSYVEQMSAALQDYLRRLLEGWLRLYAEFDGFIMLMHAVHAAQQAEEPQQAKVRQQQAEAPPQQAERHPGFWHYHPWLVFGLPAPWSMVSCLLSVSCLL